MREGRMKKVKGREERRRKEGLYVGRERREKER